MTTVDKKCDIAVVLPDISLEGEFDYLIPDELFQEVKLGSRVVVPFGRTKRKAYVIALKSESDYPRAKLRKILSCEGHFIPEGLLKLADWMANYYCSSRIHTVRNLLPAPLRKGAGERQQVTKYMVKEGIDLPAYMESFEEKHPARTAILKTLNMVGSATASYLCREAKCSASPIKTLLKAGIIVEEREDVIKNPFSQQKLVPTQALKLTEDQEKSHELICSCLDSNDYNTVLLHGITGCGKTEIYMQAIAHALTQDKQAIVLVPEISLTPQTEYRFRARFGEKVSVLHSRLSDGERNEQWLQIYEGKTQIVVGARSALFAPFRNIGLIVVDEEHESSYKQDKSPRYNARDVAVVRAHLEKCTVVLGSATPSFESLSNAKSGKYLLSRIDKRVDHAELPEIETVDMTIESMQRGGAQVFSKRLIEAIEKQLQLGMQTILFINRRGYATQLQCSKCSHVSACPDCDRPYTFHQHNSSLSCNYCGSLKIAPKSCPDCHSRDLIYSGIGTEKIERMCRGLFPRAKISRMDSDTMTKKDSHRETLDEFRNGKTDILIGTQMIAKGLDFPRVTLVGVMFADQGLHIPDFRASERTFQLLTQVAGRSGRGAYRGRVLVQTYSPKHSAIQYAIEGDMEAFYEEEMFGREIMKFPPLQSMTIVHFRGEDEAKTQEIANQFQEEVKKHIGTEDVRLLPVIPSGIAKVKKHYRFQFTIIATKMAKITRVLRHLRFHGKIPKGVDVAIDIDPQHLM